MVFLDHDDGDESRSLRFRRRTAQADPGILGVRDTAQSGHDNLVEHSEEACELDCLVGVVPKHRLREAAARACHLRVGADRVLIAAGDIDERTYLRRLAQHCGMAVETFGGRSRDDVLLDECDLGHAGRLGIMRLSDGADAVMVVTPQMFGARGLVAVTARYPTLSSRLRVATSGDMQHFLLHRIGDQIAKDAADGLREMCPTLSAAPRLRSHPGRVRVARIAVSLALAVALTLLPDFAVWFWSQWVALWFVAAIGLRLAAAFWPHQPPLDLPPLPDAELPLYTVIVALYREARSVAQLLRALERLDYPREKLDLILMIEADDLETAAAIAQLGRLPHLRVLIAPGIGPRTKPKALNCGLSFVRGSFITVFDAEDRPDPGQLRAALDAFRAGDDDVACAQASLCIENVTDSLFTRMFAAEYAGQFDATLPGFAAMRLPLLLGGSSNHFRADALRAVGGWDSWNVTEDADLGLRLARFGYRAVTFVSSTQEEAPICFAPWLKQRSRWMKGWMQTWSVHTRTPIRFWREAGWRGVVMLNLIIGCHIVSALIYPVFILVVLFETVAGGGQSLRGLLTPLHFTAIFAGLLATGAIGLRGLARRGRVWNGWILLLTPFYWVCLSIATWRALWQLLHEPYRWEKTEHGLTTQRAPPTREVDAAPLSRFARQRKRFRSVAASSGVRFRLNGAMNLPFRSIR